MSVVIPTYNRRRLIVETLDSVRAQTYPHWEAIVVDDGSTDDTWAYLEQVSQEEPRIRPFRREGEVGNANVCRNQGVAYSSGRYVIFLDSDDLLARDCLERRVQHMEAHPELGYIAYLSELFDNEPGDVGILWNVFTTESDLTRFVRLDTPWSTTGPIWRREVIEQYPWDESMLSWQDGEQHARILAMGTSGAGVNQQDNYVRRPPGGKGNTTDRARSCAHVVSHLRSYLSLAELLVDRDAMTTERRLAIVAVAYGECRCLAQMGGRSDARRFWAAVLRKALRGPESWIARWMGFPLWVYPLNGFCADVYLRMRWVSYWAVRHRCMNRCVLSPGPRVRS